VGMHKGLALSPLLFVIVMEAISREFRVAGRCCIGELCYVMLAYSMVTAVC